MSILKSYLGLGGTEASPANTTSQAHPLPASWYSSGDMYELERRAIFSRKWLLTTHKLRFPNTGDWLKYNISGYAFILVKDREGNVNAFHNICRHRAFPVVTGDGGTSRIFSCQYHGWSYGLNGKLAKAPGYQELEGFDKSKNGLLPIHVHVDANGFVWLNMDADEKPEISWEDDFKGIDLQSVFEKFNSDDFDFDDAQEATGDYNWKILADTYNEKSQHHASPFTIDIQTSTPEEIAKGLRDATSYYFPNASVTISPHAFFIRRFVPTGPTTCAMRYEIFRNKSSSEKDFETVTQAYKGIVSEDEKLYNEAQKSLSARTSSEGELQPQLENVPLHFQGSIRDLIEQHQKREEESHEEFWPARQRLPKDAAVSKEDMDFCSKLTPEGGGCCGGGACGAGPAPAPATAPEIMIS